MHRCTAPSRICPAGGASIAWLLGPDPYPDVGAQWLCHRDGSKWRVIGEKGELVPLAVAQTRGD